MTICNFPDAILRTAQQIDHLKQQIEAAPDDKRLQHQLKELQILQLWQLEQEANNELNP